MIAAICRTLGDLWQLVDELEQLTPRPAALDELEATLALLEEELSDTVRARLARLAHKCVCGRDRGDHLELAPHGSDPDEPPRGLPVCKGFVPEPAHSERVAGGERDPGEPARSA